MLYFGTKPFEQESTQEFELSPSGIIKINKKIFHEILKIKI